MFCGIIGDSIALGLALISSCDYKVKSGASTVQISSYKLPNCYDQVIVSTGTNMGPKNLSSLHKIRGKICAKKVVWILPYKNNRYLIKSVAISFGDKTISFSRTSDGVHPYSYYEIKRKLF